MVSSMENESLLKLGEVKMKWKCGNCGKEYTLNQYVQLSHTKMVEEDIDPMRQHGYTGVCECGYRFYLDRWILHDFVKIHAERIKGEEKKCVNMKVSSVFLEMNHGYDEGKELWYETMIFPQVEWLECGFLDRFKTKEEAIGGQNRILDMLKNGKYSIVRLEKDIEYIDNIDNNRWKLVMDDSEDKVDALYYFIKMITGSGKIDIKDKNDIEIVKKV